MSENQAENQTIRPNGRGGKRNGAGRPKGRLMIASLDEKLAIEEKAKAFAETALKALNDIATKGKSESARVAAAAHLLDRGYGRPRQAVEHSGNISNLPSVSIE